MQLLVVDCLQNVHLQACAMLQGFINNIISRRDIKLTNEMSIVSVFAQR